ncbi:MAG: hypothetical protein HY292_03425 [Planctomycetes bacterium]|nr:hypothetical protein [Planctomycetota bacterium]
MPTSWALIGVLAIAARPSTLDDDRPTAPPLTLEFHVSRTANLFHLVDQLSNWDTYCHAQYREHFSLSDDDARALAKHAAIRRAHGWGGGLEQTFYTTDALDAAIARGVRDGRLTEAESKTEAEVLAHFAPRIDALFDAERPRLDAFRKRIDEKSDDLASFAAKISRFCHGQRITVPVYLIANPSDVSFGGGFNGERLTLEVPHVSDAFPTFLHELMHAFVNTEEQKLKAAAEKTDGLDFTTLSEGIAYALAPGIYHGEGSDLDTEVARDVLEKRTMDDSYARFHRYGLALRPLLREALDDEHATLDSFLPRALDAWKVLCALESVKRPPMTFSAGPAYVPLSRRVGPLQSFNHSADHYRRILADARPGETLVLLYALDHPDRAVPPGFDDLMPRPWSEIEGKLRAGETVELTGNARKLHVVLLAAPTVKALEKVIAETRTLSP